MERDEQRNAEEPIPRRSPEEIVEESSPEGDVEAGDSVFARKPSAPLDESAGANVPASSPSASDLSEGESESEPPTTGCAGRSGMTCAGWPADCDFEDNR